MCRLIFPNALLCGHDSSLEPVIKLTHLLSQNVYLLFLHSVWVADPSSFAVHLSLIKIRSIKLNQGKKGNFLRSISDHILQLNCPEGNIMWFWFFFVCLFLLYFYSQPFLFFLIRTDNKLMGYTLFFGSMEGGDVDF